MRKWILRFHLYGGLLCAPYLVVFGFSSLHFNHHFAFVATSPNPVEWEEPLEVEPISDDAALASAVRDALGLGGWTLPWKTRRDAGGDLEFDLERPGKSYAVHASFKEHRARVVERHKGFWQVINSLHAMGSVPNLAFTSWWGLYTEVCVAFVLFSAASGVYLWAASQREQHLGLASLVGGAVVSLGFILYIVLRG